MLTERYENGGKWIYVFSAFKNSIAENSSDRWNTTDILIEIAERISQKDEKIALEKAKELEEFYQERIETELSDHSEKEEVLSFLKEEFEKLQNAITESISGWQIPSKENDYSITFDDETFSIMWWGEMLVSKIYSETFGKENTWINTYGMEKKKSIESIRNEVAEKAMHAIERENIAFVPGYSWNLDGWLFRKVGRGYSDWTAGNLYAAIRKKYPEENVAFMLKKLYNLSSADPREVKDVQILTHISYELLLQMVDPDGADAGFVNRAAAMPEIFRNNGYMQVYTDSGIWTVITMQWPENPPKWIEFVQSRRVQKVRIHSYHMNRDGYFAFVTWFLANHGCSIIDDSSDATSINLMISVNKKEWISEEKKRFDTVCEKLKQELKIWEEDEDSEVSVEHTSHTLIFVGWENINQVGILSEITGILANAGINLWPVIQTDKPKVIVFGVSENEQKKAISLLHRELIENKN